MRVLVTGAAGMLAQALVPELRRRGHEVVAPDRAALDVTDRRAVTDAVERASPEIVVQCAAYTAVDAAEADEATAFRVNADATACVADACRRVGARFVYPSTDYVFPGNGARPYLPDDPTAPVNAYGRSKLAGEREALRAPGALVVRTSWVYGAGGGNFVDTVLRLAAERDQLEVVDDQVGRPTWTVDLSRTLVELMERAVSGIFHATGGGRPVTWYDVARHALDLRAVSTPLRAVPSGAFPRPAPRPAYSVLDCSATSAAVGREMTDWRHSLANYLGSRSAND